MKNLPWIVAIVGVVVLYGWLNELDALTRIVPGFVTMKIATALSFVFMGLCYAVIGAGKHGNWRDAIVSATMIATLIVMGSHLWSSITGEAAIFAHAENDPMHTIREGVPSICTMVAFLTACVGAACWISGHYMILEWCARAMLLSGSVALFGYAIGEESFYCYFDSRSSAMALHTSLLFTFLGASACWKVTPKNPIVRPDLSQQETKHRDWGF